MGIDLPTFRALQLVRATLPQPTVRMLCLGYPDLLVEEDVLRTAVRDGDWLKPQQDGDAIARWHHWPGKIFDTDYIFKGMGIEAEYWDIEPSRGVEKTVDLNWTLTPPEQFDIVIDAGTIEHCFNIAAAIQTTRLACKTGGFIIHCNPMTMVNHGFYNLSPTFFIDFYGQNGDTVISCQGVFGRLTAREVIDLKSIGRIQAPAEYSLLTVVKRGAHELVRYPTQSKYLKK